MSLLVGRFTSKCLCQKKFFFFQAKANFRLFFFGQIAITRILFVSICDNTYTKSIRVIAKKCTCYREKWSKKYTCYREQKCTCFLLLRCSLSIPRPSNFFFWAPKMANFDDLRPFKAKFGTFEHLWGSRTRLRAPRFLAKYVRVIAKSVQKNVRVTFRRQGLVVNFAYPSVWVTHTCGHVPLRGSGNQTYVLKVHEHRVWW